MMNGLLERFAMFAGDLLALQLRAAGLLAVACLVAYLLRRRSASVRHRVWAFGLAAVVALPLATPWLPLIDLGGERQVATMRVAFGAVAGADEAIAAGDLVSRGAANSTRADATPATRDDLAPALWVAAWLLGAAVLCGRTLVGSIGIASLRRCARAPGAALAEHLAAIPRVSLAVLVSDDVPTPMVGGLWRPVILLPAEFESSSLERVRLVLAHELGHVRQGDHRWLVLAAVARALCWIDPLVWLASARLRQVAECAADDAVLATGVRPSAYAAELVAYARLLSGRRTPVTGVSIVGRSSLATRIGALLRPEQRRDPPTVAFVIPLALGSLGAAASLAMVHVCEESREPASPTTTDAASSPAPAAIEPTIPSARVRVGLDRLEMSDVVAGSAATLELDQGRIAAQDLQGHLVTALDEKFATTTMHVSADDAVPFGTIVDVLYTAGRSGVRSWVLGWNGREIAVNPPKFAPPTEPVGFHVRWSADELAVEHVGRGGEACVIVPRRTEALADDPSLSAIGAAVCKLCTGDGCAQLAFQPGEDTPYAEAMAVASAAMDAARGCKVELVVMAGVDWDASACQRGDAALDALLAP